ncbi:MAG: hypothetical protein QG606_180, partial [Patescibacteria group bacterium]|nr:hypothetical protein [Patescibacteria group bacterium]
MLRFFPPRGFPATRGVRAIGAPLD